MKQRFRKSTICKNLSFLYSELSEIEKEEISVDIEKRNLVIQEINYFLKMYKEILENEKSLNEQA